MIETDRLTLRRYVLADVDELVALHADPEWLRFLPPAEPFDHQRATARVEADEREWEAGHRALSIVDRETGRFLGRASLYDWPQFGETEVGYVLHAHARGRGCATEAAAGLITWGFETLAVDYITAIIDLDNDASVRVAERLGMTKLRDDKLFDDDVVIHAVSRDRWALARRQSSS